MRAPKLQASKPFSATIKHVKRKMHVHNKITTLLKQPTKRAKENETKKHTYTYTYTYKRPTLSCGVNGGDVL